MIAFRIWPRPRRLQKRYEAAADPPPLTYNDPVIFLEYAIDVAEACRERGLKTVAVSAGYISPAPRIEFLKSREVQRHVGAELIPHPGGLRFNFPAGVVLARDEQGCNLEPNVRLMLEVLERLEHGSEFARAKIFVENLGKPLRSMLAAIRTGS